MCVDAGSPYYGFTRHVINNGFDDDSFLDGPFDVFFDVLEGFVDAWLKGRKTDKYFSTDILTYLSDMLDASASDEIADES